MFGQSNFNEAPEFIPVPVVSPEEKLENAEAISRDILSPGNMQLVKAIIAKERELYDAFGGSGENINTINTTQFDNDEDAKKLHDSILTSRNEMIERLKDAVGDSKEALDTLWNKMLKNEGSLMDTDFYVFAGLFDNDWKIPPKTLPNSN